MDRTELGRFLFTAEQLGHQRAALSVLLGLNGLRVSEACETDIGDLQVAVNELLSVSEPLYAVA